MHYCYGTNMLNLGVDPTQSGQVATICDFRWMTLVVLSSVYVVLCIWILNKSRRLLILAEVCTLLTAFWLHSVIGFDVPLVIYFYCYVFCVHFHGYIQGSLAPSL